MKLKLKIEEILEKFGIELKEDDMWVAHMDGDFRNLVIEINEDM